MTESQAQVFRDEEALMEGTEELDSLTNSVQATFGSESVSSSSLLSAPNEDFREEIRNIQEDSSQEPGNVTDSKPNSLGIDSFCPSEGNTIDEESDSFRKSLRATKDSTEASPEDVTQKNWTTASYHESDSSDDDDFEEEYIDSLLEESFKEEDCSAKKKLKLHDDDKQDEETEDIALKCPVNHVTGGSQLKQSKIQVSNDVGGQIPLVKRPTVHRYVEPETISKEGIRVAAHLVTKKVVLKKLNSDSFEVLPEGWMEATHFSGMPVYLHRQTRVCSLSKPYLLGPGSVRKHDIPLSAIPCLQYKTEMERLKKEEEERKQEDSNKINVKVESVKDSKKRNSLHFMTVRDYCSKVFEFRELEIRKFKTWADRRAHSMLKRSRERPSLPEGTKLIKVPIIPNQSTSGHSSGALNSSDSNETANDNNPKDCDVRKKTDGDKATSIARHPSNAHLKKEFVLNPAGKSHVCILHEFVQHSQRVQPMYKFSELENAATPYSATVVINGMEMGVGYGSSKKIAKSEAAKKTLDILIPDYSETIGEEGKKKSEKSRLNQESSELPTTSSGQQQEESQELDIFHTVKITDDRVPDMCNTAAQPGPYQVLVECLKRNNGLGDTDIDFKIEHIKKREDSKKLKNTFVMTVGKHTVNGPCKNSREGKQKASQLMLQLLHPNLSTWGSLLLLYGRGSCKTPKEKREDEKHITELQVNASSHRPNFHILNKLKEEMIKLKEHQEAGNDAIDVFGDSNNLNNVNL